MKNKSLFNEIVRRYDLLIKQIIARYFNNTMDREDVFQEILILIMEKLDSLDLNRPNSNIKGWIAVLTRNKCISILRKEKNINDISQNINTDDFIFTNATLSFFNDENIVPIINSIKIINIEKLLSKLNEKDRKIIFLRFFEEFEIKEIDKIMGLKNTSVYIKRIIEKLRKSENSKDFFEYFDGYEIE